jgi:hypothetical protein
MSKKNEKADNLTVEELLSIVKNNRPLKVNKQRVHGNSDVRKFTEELKLKNGHVAVPNFFLYWKYRNDWSGARTTTASRIDFFRTIAGLGFLPVREGKQRYYLLDDATLDFTATTVARAKKFEQEQKQKKV